MMFCDFTTTTHGKWILAGEHAVLRGYGALVFPILSKELTLSYTPSSTELSADFAGVRGEDLRLLFWSVLEHGQKLREESLNRLTGHFNITSTIPIGEGMGASAALCVAVARWFESQGLLNHIAVEDYAKRLEHLFHGKSSGLDIAGAASEHGVYFEKGLIMPVLQTWKPLWYLSSCGQIGITSHCIQQVNEYWRLQPLKAERTDKQMAKAVALAHQSLGTADDLDGLKHAINLAAECFSEWGLVSDTLATHMAFLREQGALAVKPTGSGGGGYVLSLWSHPPSITSVEMINI